MFSSCSPSSAFVAGVNNRALIFGLFVDDLVQRIAVFGRAVDLGPVCAPGAAVIGHVDRRGRVGGYIRLFFGQPVVEGFTLPVKALPFALSLYYFVVAEKHAGGEGR